MTLEAECKSKLLADFAVVLHSESSPYLYTFPLAGIARFVLRQHYLEKSWGRGRHLWLRKITIFRDRDLPQYVLLNGGQWLLTRNARFTTVYSTYDGKCQGTIAWGNNYRTNELLHFWNSFAGKLFVCKDDSVL